MKKFRSGDLVEVVRGKSKGIRGKILRIVGEKVVVEGANLATKHVKPRPNHNPQLSKEGGIKKIELPLAVSNVMHVDSASALSRVGFRFEEQDGQQVKVRYYKSTGEAVAQNEQVK